MKKSTRQKIVVLFIIIIFGMSSIAFFVLSAVGTISPAEQESISSPVVEEELSPQLENAYIQNGITFLKYYYNEKDSLYAYIGTLPNTLTTLNGQTQLVVERINDGSRRVSISSIYGGIEDIEQPTEENIFSSLCNHLVSTPPECAIKALNASG